MSEICIEVKSVDLVKATTKTNKPYEFVDLMYKNKSFQDKMWQVIDKNKKKKWP